MLPCGLWLTVQPVCKLNQTQKPKNNVLHCLLEDDEYRGSCHYLLLKKKTITQNGLNSISNRSARKVGIKKKKRLFFVEESLFFRVVFAFVDSQLPLRFDAAAFASVFAPQKGSKLKEGAFATECAHCGSPIVSSFV